MKHMGLFSPPEDLFFEAAQDRCLDIADELVDEIKIAAPKVTGHLAESFSSERYENGAKVVTSVDYALDVEYGHDVVDENGAIVGHASAEPYIRPSIEIVRGRHA